MKTFPLYGRTVDIPMELVNFNVLRDNYVKMAINARKEFAVKYKRFGGIEQVLNGYKGICDELLIPILSQAKSDLLSNKILDADTKVIISALSRRNKGDMFNSEIALEELQDKFEEIVEDQQAKTEYRTARRRGRGAADGLAAGSVWGGL